MIKSVRLTVARGRAGGAQPHHRVLVIVRAVPHAIILQAVEPARPLLSVVGKGTGSGLVGHRGAAAAEFEAVQQLERCGLRVEGQVGVALPATIQSAGAEKGS